MAKGKKIIYDFSWAEKFLERRVDFRTEWGGQARATVLNYVKEKNTLALSLLSSFALKFPHKKLIDLLKVHTVGYRHDVPSSCICGKYVKEDWYVMKLKNCEKEFNLGSHHYKILPGILDCFGFSELKDSIARAGDGKKSKELDEIVRDSKSIHGRLEVSKEGLRTFSKMARFFKEGDVSIYAKNSFNWLRDEIAKGRIKDRGIVELFFKVKRAPHLVRDEELFELADYEHRNRKYRTDAVLGSFKDDFIYMSSLRKDDELSKAFGNTKSKRGKTFGDKGILEELGKEEMTFHEARVVKNMFPELEKIRREANRSVADRYGTGIEWNYLMKELKPIFDKERSDMHDEYEKFGEIIKGHVFTKKEYLALKGLIKRADIRGESARENYLRMFSIKEFRNIAPIIAVMGRKVKMARKEYEDSRDEEGSNKGEWVCGDLIRQDYMLKEDFVKNSKKLGVDDPEKMMTGLSEHNIWGIKSIMLEKFLERHGKNIGTMYKNGLVAKKYLTELNGTNDLIRYYKMLRAEKVEEISEELSMKMRVIDKYVNEGLVYVEGKNVLEGMSTRFLTDRGRKYANNQYKCIEHLVGTTGIKIKDSDNIKKKVEELKRFGECYYLHGGNEVHSFFCAEFIDPEKKELSGIFRAYKVPELDRHLNELRNCVEVSKEFAERLVEINEASKLLNIRSSYTNSLHDQYLKGKRIFVDKEFKKKADRMYDHFLKEVLTKHRIGYFR